MNQGATGGDLRAAQNTAAREVDGLDREEDPRRVLFHIVAAAGMIVAAFLGIAQVLDRPEIQLGDERVDREDAQATVQVLATNETEETTYCIEVRIGALDVDGLDLEDAPARPQSGDGELRPGRTMNFTATFDDLTEADFEEELDEFDAYVAEQERC